MSWAGSAFALAVVSAGAQQSAQHQAKKGQKHAKERARGRENELADQAGAEASAMAEGDRKDRAKRAEGYARNTNIFASGIGGMADQARKTLTGQ